MTLEFNQGFGAIWPPLILRLTSVLAQQWFRPVDHEPSLLDFYNTITICPFLLFPLLRCHFVLFSFKPIQATCHFDVNECLSIIKALISIFFPRMIATLLNSTLIKRLDYCWFNLCHTEYLWYLTSHFCFF